MCFPAGTNDALEMFFCWWILIFPSHLSFFSICLRHCLDRFCETLHRLTNFKGNSNAVCRQWCSFFYWPSNYISKYTCNQAILDVQHYIPGWNNFIYPPSKGVFLETVGKVRLMVVNGMWLEQPSALPESIGFLLPVEAGSTSSRLSDGMSADTRHASQTSLCLLSWASQSGVKKKHVLIPSTPVNSLTVAGFMLVSLAAVSLMLASYASASSSVVSKDSSCFQGL